MIFLSLQNLELMVYFCLKVVLYWTDSSWEVGGGIKNIMIAVQKL